MKFGSRKVAMDNDGSAYHLNVDYWVICCSALLLEVGILI